ncbi:ABC transporter permease subunit [Bacillota bacterium LX-D]|nr:ABC transporter permease subunit [Bacillota bacterium LX-D]
MNSLRIAKRQSIIRSEFTGILVSTIAIGSILCMVTVISSLFIESDISAIAELVQMPQVWEAISITVISILISYLLVVTLGIPTAFYIVKKSGRSGALLDMVLNIPMVLPPSITGLALLMTFGRYGLVGSFLSNLSISLPFTLAAVIIVQVFVAMPYFVQMLKSAFQSVDKTIEDAAVDCGATLKDLIFRIYLPMNVKPFISASIMACLRAAGEFGATIMFAGNMEGKTQTISTAIYSFTQQNTKLAVSLAVLHIMIFLLPLLLFKTTLKKLE